MKKEKSAPALDTYPACHKQIKNALQNLELNVINARNATRDEDIKYLVQFAKDLQNRCNKITEAVTTWKIMKDRSDKYWKEHVPTELEIELSKTFNK